MKQELTILLVLVCAMGCGQKKAHMPESLRGVNDAIAYIDSCVASLYGWEPQDSTYDHAKDQWVFDMLDDYRKHNPDYEIHGDGEYPIAQSRYDDARKTWAEFRSLCNAEKYKDAIDYYDGGGAGQKMRTEYFLLYLKSSSIRYAFFAQVLWPLLATYRDLDYAYETYITLLKLEKSIEDLSFVYDKDGSYYYPEVYPDVVSSLGFALTEVGRVEEALALFTDVIEGVYAITDDVLVANYHGTYYRAKVFCIADRVDLALKVFENLKSVLEKDKSSYDPDELAECLQVIDEQINVLKPLVEAEK